MTWTGQAFNVGQELTAAQMTNLQADITALANGDGGAPAIQAAAMAAASVGRSQIANSTTTTAGTINAGIVLNVSLNDWAIFPMIHSAGAQQVEMGTHATDGGSASSPRFTLYNSGGTNRAYDVDHRWIIAA